MRQDEKQGGQQEDDGWVMVQRMHGRDVVGDKQGRLYRVRADGDVDRRIVERVMSTLRTGDTFNTCWLFQTQPFQPGVMPSSFHGFVILGG